MVAAEIPAQGRRIVAAEWVLPVAGPPLREGAVAIRAGRVEWVGRLADLPHGLRSWPVESRGGVVVPGLVNAHTHLQYTHFSLLGRMQHGSFATWSNRFQSFYDRVDTRAYWHASALDGARRAVASGTTLIGDVVTDDEARGALGEAGISGVEYLEVFAKRERQWGQSARTEFFSRLRQPSTVVTGISPHAPYSLDASVIRDLVRTARQHGLRLHSHVAESPAESDLYERGDGPMLELLGSDVFELVRVGGSGYATAAYADSLGLLSPSTHVAHAIYLNREERDLLARRGTQVTLCPRSNSVIGLDAAPVADYLAEGHDISVGTDSLGSAPSLDLMADVRALALLARAQGYDGDDLGERLVRAATVGGAKALGLHAPAGYGVLAPGSPADLAVFDVPVAAGASVEEQLVAGGVGRCTLTVAAGRVLHDTRTGRI